MHGIVQGVVRDKCGVGECGVRGTGQVWFRASVVQCGVGRMLCSRVYCTANVVQGKCGAGRVWCRASVVQGQCGTWKCGAHAGECHSGCAWWKVRGHGAEHIQGVVQGECDAGCGAGCGAGCVVGRCGAVSVVQDECGAGVQCKQMCTWPAGSPWKHHQGSCTALRGMYTALRGMCTAFTERMHWHLQGTHWACTGHARGTR